MRNQDRWNMYMKDIGSPQSFIDAGFHFIISSCLQRRVWSAPSHRPLYANQLIVLCGEPGIGKGQVIIPVSHFLSFFKKKKIEEIAEDEDGNIRNLLTGKKARLYAPNLLPTAPDATTWQALIDAFVDSYEARIIGKSKDGKIQRYHHCSLYFCLEEMSSLFKTQTHDLCRFFLKAWDCGDYTYDTRKNVRDQIKNMCLNFLAGTTPSFMQEILETKILDDGVAARTIYVFAEKNRFNKARVPELDQDQRIAEKELLCHIKELMSLYGCVNYTEEADKFLDDWWPRLCDGKIPFPNNSVKLKHYYTRKLVHVKKTAMAMHFGETTNIHQPISLNTILKAIEYLDKIEPTMHLAMVEKSVNPLVIPGQRLVMFLRNKGKATEVEIMNELFGFFKNFKEDFPDLLNAFQQQGKIEKVQSADGRTRYALRKASHPIEIKTNE